MSKGKNGVPCGAYREFTVQLVERDYQNVQVMQNYRQNMVVKMSQLTLEWWL